MTPVSRWAVEDHIAPVACVYRPLNYAWPAHEAYLHMFGGNHNASPFFCNPKGL